MDIAEAIISAYEYVPNISGPKKFARKIVKK
jgi:hypothetical protein